MSHDDAQTQTMHGYGTQEEPSLAAIKEGRLVKRIHWAAGLPEEMLAQFTREAMIVARLRHPHVVPVHAAGKLGDGTPYLVMERLRGRTLEDVVELGPVPAAELAAILRGVASALSAAHAAGVVHGGICADTVFLAEMPGYRWGFPMVVDFGIACLGAVGRADARADLSALVALAARAHGRPFPPAAQRVLERATSWNAQLPFASVTSFMEALEEALAIASAAAPAAASALPATITAPVSATPRMITPAPASMSAPAPAPSPAPIIAAPVAAAAPAAAPAPSSLTQQFFAEGDKQDSAHAVDDEGDDQDDLAPNAPAASLTRVPRNRAQIATSIVLTFGTVGIIVGTLVSLSTARDVRPAAPAVVQRPADVPVSAPRAPADARASAARTSGEPSSAYRARSHQGRTAAAHRGRLAEPPRFVPSPVTPAVTTAPASQPAPAAGPAAPAPAGAAVAAPAAAPAMPAPAATPPMPAAPSEPAPEAPAAAAVSAPPIEAPAPSPPATAAQDTSGVSEDDLSPPWDQTEGEAPATP